MKELTTKVTMTLKEITDLLETRHNNAMRTVEKMMENQEFGMSTQIEYSYGLPNGGTKTIKTYQLNKRQSIAVASRLNTPYLMRLIDRLEELEAKQVKPKTRLELIDEMREMELESIRQKEEFDTLQEEFLKVMEEEGNYQFITVAGLLGINGLGRTTLMRELVDRGILLKNRLPARSQIENGRFVVKRYYIDKYDRHCTTTLVTEKGFVFLAKLFHNWTKPVPPVQPKPEPILPPPPSLVMLVEPLDIQAWYNVGWTDEMLLNQGKATFH